MFWVLLAGLHCMTRDTSRREFVDIDHVEEAIASFLSR